VVDQALAAGAPDSRKAAGLEQSNPRGACASFMLEAAFADTQLMAVTSSTVSDDPRKLRTLLERASALASQHDVPSVMIGLIAQAGDLRFPDFVDFLQSALRVDDTVFRMTRDRVVLHLADVDERQATEVLTRLLARFHDEFPQLEEAGFVSYYIEIRPGDGEPSVKEVLPTLFGAPPAT
jgi:hypothetical protein